MNHMDILQFVLRMTVFAVSFYFMAEFALLSKVDTSVGVGVIIAVVAAVLIHTLVHRAKSVVQCPVCANRMVQ
jgi:hypothetical protein